VLRECNECLLESAGVEQVVDLGGLLLEPNISEHRVEFHRDVTAIRVCESGSFVS